MKTPARMLKTQAGFSLIELMIVVAIIGILASIAVPNFQKFQRRAKQSEGKGYLAGIYSAENGFRAEWNGYSSDLLCIGFKDNNLAAPSNGLAGRGNYSAGFATAGGVTGAASGTTCNATAANSIAAPQPSNGLAALPGAVAGTAIGAAPFNTFTAGTQGILGGTANDQWTITEAKTLTNTASGL